MKKFLLSGIMALAVTCSWAADAKTTSPYTGVAPTDIVSGGDYYLYNVESGLWLQNNDRKANDWHTRGQLGTRGLDFQLNSTDGGYYINAKFGHTTINVDNYYLDTDATSVWVFTSVSGSVSNAVTISSGTKYLTADNYTAGKGYNNNYNAGTQDEAQWYLNNPENSTNGTWQIVTKEERLAKMLEDGKTEAQDASWLVKSPDFANNDTRYSSWTKEGTWARGGDANGDWGRGSMCMESWNSGDTPHMYQTVEVPNGRYSLTVQGFYRDGVVENIGATYAAGTEVIRAYFYANDVQKNLRSIIDGHTEAVTSPDRWRVQTGDYYVPDNMADCNRCMNISYGYPNDAIEVKVTTGSVKIGVKKTGSVDGDWVIVDNFKLAYLGPIDVSEYITALNAAITAAQAIDQTKLTEAAKTKLNDAITAAQAYTESVDADAISAATATLTAVVDDVKDMDITSLQNAINYLTNTRGYTDATASDILANSVKATEVNNATSSLVIRFKQSVADKSTQPTQFTTMGTAVVGTENNDFGTVTENLADGFYMYNVGTGRWFCGGDDWGAHAAVGFPGIKVTTPQNTYGTGNYNSIVTWLCNGNWGSSDQLNHGGYCDTGGNGWKFWAKDAANGIYTVSRNGSNTGDNSENGYGTKNLLGFTNTTLMRADTDKSGADDPNNQWIFVTEAQRDAMTTEAMASATIDNPVDLTYKIGMPGFNQRERVEGSNQSDDVLPWTCNHSNYKYSDSNTRHIICNRGDNHADFCVDIYGADWNDEFSLTQTITGLTPGKYIVKVQGYNNGGETANKAKLVAGDKSVVLREQSSETELPWQSYAETTFQAVEYFQNGLYWNEVECVVGTDGKLTIGVESPKITGSHVALFDNFRLEYIGAADPETTDVTVTDAGYATFVAPFSINAIPSGVEAYAAQVGEHADGYVYLAPVTAIPVGTAVVLKNKGTYTFTATSEIVSLGEDNDLVAATSDVTASGTQYILAEVDSKVGFHKATTGTTIAAGKGYLVITSGDAKAFYPFEDDEVATSIEAVETIPANAVIYNVAGQRVAQPQRGINIINGKKYIVK